MDHTSSETPLWWACHEHARSSLHARLPSFDDASHFTLRAVSSQTQEDGEIGDIVGLIEPAVYERISSSALSMTWMYVLQSSRNVASHGGRGDPSCWARRLVALLPDRLVLFQAIASRVSDSHDEDPQDESHSVLFRVCGILSFTGDCAVYALDGTGAGGGAGGGAAPAAGQTGGVQQGGVGTDMEFYSNRRLWTFRTSSSDERDTWLISITAQLRAHEQGIHAATAVTENALLAMPDMAAEGNFGAALQPGSHAATSCPTSTPLPISISHLLEHSAIRQRLRAFARRLLPEHIPLLKAWEHLHATVRLAETESGSSAAVVGLEQSCERCGRALLICRRLYRLHARFFATGAQDRISLPAQLMERVSSRDSEARIHCAPVGRWLQVGWAVESLIKDRLVLPYCRALIKQATGGRKKKGGRGRAASEPAAPSGLSALGERIGSFRRLSMSGSPQQADSHAAAHPPRKSSLAAALGLAGGSGAGSGVGGVQAGKVATVQAQRQLPIERERRGSIISRSAAGLRAASVAVFSSLTASPSKPPGRRDIQSGAPHEHAADGAHDAGSADLMARLRVRTEGEDSLGLDDEDVTTLSGSYVSGLQYASVPGRSMLAVHEAGIGRGAAQAMEADGSAADACLYVLARLVPVSAAIVQSGWYGAVRARARREGQGVRPTAVLLAHTLSPISLLFAQPGLVSSLPVSSHMVQSLLAAPLHLPDAALHVALPLAAATGSTPSPGEQGKGALSLSMEALDLLCHEAGMNDGMGASVAAAGGGGGGGSKGGGVLPAVLQAVEDAVLEAATTLWEWAGESKERQEGNSSKVSLHASSLRASPGHPLFTWLCEGGRVLGGPGGEGQDMLAAGTEAAVHTGLFALPPAQWLHVMHHMRTLAAARRNATDVHPHSTGHARHSAPVVIGAGGGAEGKPAMDRKARVKSVAAGHGKGGRRGSVLSIPTLPPSQSHPSLPLHAACGLRYPVPETGRDIVWACWWPPPMDTHSADVQSSALPACSDADVLSTWSCRQGEVSAAVVGPTAGGLRRTIQVAVDYPAARQQLALSLEQHGRESSSEGCPLSCHIPGRWSLCLACRYADGAVELWPLTKAQVQGTAGEDGQHEAALASLGPSISQAQSLASLLTDAWPGSASAGRHAHAHAQAACPVPYGMLHTRDVLDVCWTRDARLPAHTCDLLTPGAGMLRLIPWRVSTAPALYAALREGATCARLSEESILSGTVHAQVLPAGMCTLPSGSSVGKIRVQLRARVVAGVEPAGVHVGGGHPGHTMTGKEKDKAKEEGTRSKKLVVLTGKVQKRGLIRTSFQPRVLQLVLSVAERERTGPPGGGQGAAGQGAAGTQTALDTQDSTDSSSVQASARKGALLGSVLSRMGSEVTASSLPSPSLSPSLAASPWGQVCTALRIRVGTERGWWEPHVPAFTSRRGRSGSAPSLPLVQAGEEESVEVRLEYGKAAGQGGGGGGAVRALLGLASKAPEGGIEVRGTVPVWLPGRGGAAGGRILSIAWEPVLAPGGGNVLPGEGEAGAAGGAQDWATPTKGTTQPTGRITSLAARLRGQASPGTGTGTGSTTPASPAPVEHVASPTQPHQQGNERKFDLHVCTAERMWHFRVEGAPAAGAWVAALTAFSAGRDAALAASLPPVP